MTQRILNIKEESYTSNLNETQLKRKLEDLFEQRTLGLGGRFTNEKEFMAYDKWVVIGWDTPNVKRQAAYLKGKITKEENGTSLKIEVKPNSILPVFAISSALIGIIITLNALTNTADDKFFLILGLVFLALGIVYYPLSIFYKNRLRNKIVQYLDLSKV